ncbi:MAG TPA: RNA 2',3'-cyclic phosphodiesterase [Ktedonobacteraceae bacterium]|nr:RNA 2',3'-cyclic phosphodiesterase [Ktedonobacteraceae bacterium]
MTRTFIALELNEALQRHLSKVIREMASALPDLRWVNPTGIHLTLAFLGELDNTQLEQATAAAAVAARQTQPFSYRLTKPGFFGSPRSPRVIWMGIEEPVGKLTRLHRVLNQDLEQRGFEIDKRPFSPHLTLARVKAPLTPDEQQTLQRLLADAHLSKPSPPYTVNGLAVMKSELSRSGAKYSAIREMPFGK